MMIGTAGTLPKVSQHRYTLALAFYLRMIAGYIDAFGFVRGSAKVAEHFWKFKHKPRGTFATTATPHQGNVVLRANTSDLSIFWEIFVFGEYDITQLDVFAEIVQRYREIIARGKNLSSSMPGPMSA